MTPHLIKYRAFDVRIIERGGAFEVSWSCGEASGARLGFLTVEEDGFRSVKGMKARVVEG